MPLVQRLALAAFAAVSFLLFMGALVRVTGSGLGCPDWPFCYGRAIPPTTAEQIDFDHLNIDKYRKKAAQHGRDVSSITPATIRAEFNPTHTWIEYLNRLSSLPVGLATLLLLIVSLRQRKTYPAVAKAGIASFLLVLFNAWLGARVVYSGLQPGIITLHMALAILLLCILVYAAWKGTPQPWKLSFRTPSKNLTRTAQLLFILVVIEGVLGSQVREITDELAKLHAGQNRAEWRVELESTWVYLIHRSGSWAILLAALVFHHQARKSLTHGCRWLEYTITGIVLAQMVLGIVLSHVGILPTAQLLHVVLSSFLVSALLLWILGTTGPPQSSPGGSGIHKLT